MKHKIKYEIKNILEKIENDDFYKLKEDLMSVYEKLVILEHINFEKSNENKEASNPELKSIDFLERKYPSLHSDKKIEEAQEKENEINNSGIFIENDYKNNILSKEKKYLDIVLGFNDKISFQKELFNNNNQILSKEIDIINTINSRNELEMYIENLKTKYHWTSDKQEYIDRFLQIVRRRLEI